MTIAIGVFVLPFKNTFSCNNYRVFRKKGFTPFCVNPHNQLDTPDPDQSGEKLQLRFYAEILQRNAGR